MEFLTEEDLKPITILKPIQIRKLLKFGHSRMNVACTSESRENPNSVSEIQLSERFETSTETVSDEILSKDSECLTLQRSDKWLESYSICEDIFPRHVRKALEKGQKISEALKHETKRAIFTDVLKKCRRPSSSDIRKITEMFVQKYPNAIDDRINGEKTGSGYKSFETQMLYRLDNISRKTENKMPQVKRASTSTKQNSKRPCQMHIANMYNPKLSEADAEKFQKIMDELKQHFLTSIHDTQLVQELLSQSYALQRSHINEKKSTVEELKRAWPFLFESYGMSTHLKQLLGQDVQNMFNKFFTEKSSQILAYFSKSKKKSVQDLLTSLKDDEPVNANQSVAATVITLFMDHFKEDSTKIFPVFEAGTHLSDIERKLPAHPCIAIIGENLSNATQYLISVDCKIVNDHVHPKDFVTGIFMFFAMYYILNIEYPNETPITMEFIQRCIARIRSDNEHVNPKILLLTNKIFQFDWMFN